MPLVKVKEKFQVTIPTELREALHLTVGDILEATIEHDTIVLKPKVVVDRKQAWAQMERAMASVEDMAPNPEQSPQEEEEEIARMVKEHRDNMPSAVLDSTALISAFLTKRGVSAKLLRHAREGAFALFLSDEILTEAQGVLLDHERRHRQRYRYPDDQAINFIEGLRVFAELVTDLPRVMVVIRDPNDDMVIATALKANAASIVTRDDDLLSLQRYEDITILTPEAFMAMLRERGMIS